LPQRCHRVYLRQELNVFPPKAIVSFGDTISDVESALNAGVWSVGVAKTGNMIGLDENEVSSLAQDDLSNLIQKAYNLSNSVHRNRIATGRDMPLQELLGRNLPLTEPDGSQQQLDGELLIFGTEPGKAYRIERHLRNATYS